MKTKEQQEIANVPGTSIWIPLSLKEIIESAKIHPREPYYQVIERVFGGLVNGGIR